MIDDSRLIQRLRETEAIDPESVQRARDLQAERGGSLYEIVIDEGLVDERDAVRAASELFEVAHVDLRDAAVDDDVLGLLPGRLAARHEALPVDVERTEDGARLVVAMKDPSDTSARRALADEVGAEVRPVIAGPKTLRAALHRAYPDEAPAPPSGASAELDSSAPAEPSESELGRIPVKQVPVSQARAAGAGIAEESSSATAAPGTPVSGTETTDSAENNTSEWRPDRLADGSPEESDPESAASANAGADDTSDEEEASGDRLDELRSRLRDDEGESIEGRDQQDSSGPVPTLGGEGELSESFVSLALEIADASGDDLREQLRSLDHDRLLEALVLELLDAGTIELEALLSDPDDS
ncbi:MAG: hypothetical protein ABEL76_00255 [Bradymonadaceae bacterium]